jgi:hypothetical protein
MYVLEVCGHVEWEDASRMKRGANTIVLQAILAAALLAIVHSAMAVEVRTIALRFEQAPGTTGTLDYFNSFAQLSLNDSGHLAFVGLLGGGGQGVWSEGAGGLDLVARHGQQAADTPSGTTFQSFDALALNENGHVAFRASLNSANGQGVWSESTGPLRLVLRTGQQAPGFPAGATVLSLAVSGNQTSPVFNDLGQTAVIGTVTGFGSPTAIWLGTTGNVNLVARTGSQASGLAAGVNFQSIFPPVLNNAGQVAFSASYSGPGGVFGSGIWLGNATNGPVARTGTAAPGTGGNYGSFFTSYIGLNDAADAAFHGSGNGTGGFWSGHAGSLAALALEDAHAPGTPAGVSFDVFTVPAFMSNNGDIAFMARLTGSGVDTTNDAGIWLSRSGVVDLVAREGSHAPGTASGVMFETLSSPSINDAGQLAFRGVLAGAGVDATNQVGIWATDTSGNLRLILRTGDSLEVAPGDIRTISALNFTGNSAPSDGRATYFNCLGQIAFTAGFTNATSGVFVTAQLVVPESSSVMLFAVGLLNSLWIASRRRLRGSEPAAGTRRLLSTP